MIIIFISIASMILGSVAAIGQKNIKRLLAYSSISHMGYALAGVATGTAIWIHFNNNLYNNLYNYEFGNIWLFVLNEN